MRFFWNTVFNELSEGRRVFGCFVAANKKGSPGTPAARMLLLESGEQVGTIGGGIMERHILEKAEGLLSSGEKLLPSTEVLKHRPSEDAEMSGLFCGGEQTNISVIFEGETDQAIVTLICNSLEKVVPGWVVLCPHGLSIEFDDTIGAGQNEWTFRGAHDWRYAVNLVNQRRIAIFGGGHCGVALAEQMLRLDYAVTLIEPREGLFTMQGLSRHAERLHEAYCTAGALVRFPQITHAVVMTHSFPTDVEALASLLKCRYQSVGVMGSRTKIARIRALLKEQGFTDLQVSAVRAPIGLSFNSDTPEEIAVNIAAQILLERERGNEDG